MVHGTERPEDRPRARGSDLSTLIVAALAAVVAAFVTSKLWSGGALLSTAMTPVIVSLVKEYLQRPVEKIGAVARAPIAAVRTSPERVPVGVYADAPPEAERRGRVLVATDPDPDEYEELDTLVPPGDEGTTETPYRVYRKRPRRATWWRVGLATGVLAFVVAAAVITVPELLGGGSVASTGRTTLFSHHSSTTNSKSTDASGKKSSSKDADTSKSDKSSSKDSSSSSSSAKDSTSSPSQDSSSSGTSSGAETQQSQPGATTTAPDSTAGDSTTQTTPSTTTPPTTSTPSTPPGSTQP